MEPSMELTRPTTSQTLINWAKLQAYCASTCREEQEANESMRTRHSLGFSLIELVVVIGNVGVLLAILFTAVNTVRIRTQVTSCQNRIAQIGKASLNFESANMHFPTSAWQVEILDFLNSATNSVPESAIPADQTIHLFSCPSDYSPTYSVRPLRQYGNFQFCYGVWLDVENHVY